MEEYTVLVKLAALLEKDEVLSARMAELSCSAPFIQINIMCGRLDRITDKLDELLK